ncbi:hypothetical protein E4U43_004268 [Claviceps pusilla]|uniref:Exonuclease domain-containing protein n=1 Tax=Claviceps pusilla TaxID=123648 RepID=A0A9P7NH22_9HYPO|nr:hypothetical protein E4U43_004268 [Claviceps pusilla]
MSLSLKHIPCPAGKGCTAFQCIFGHAEDKPPEVEVTVTHQAEKSIRERSPPDERAPQKRIKTIEHDNRSQAQQVPKSDRTGTGTTTSLLSATRPVSPPPIRRNVETAGGRSSLAAAQQKTAPNSRHKSLHTAGNVGSVGKSDAGAGAANRTRKPESLNPRLLKSSPASHETRLKLLKLLHAELSRLNRELKVQKKTDTDAAVAVAAATAGAGAVADLIMSDQDLISKALDEEQTAALEKPAVYANVMKNKVMQYKKMKVSQWRDERIKEAPRSKHAASGGSDAKAINTGLTSSQEVVLLKHLLTDITGLAAHGYVSSIPSDEVVAAARSGLDAAKGWEKCDRCQQRFQVFPGRREEDGALTSGGTCNFHWGKAYVPAKAPGDTTRVPKRYLCCGQEVGESAGCFTHDKHVFKAGDPKRLAAVLNYAATPENANVPPDRAVCFDCEMAYTVHGMELIRLTATAWPTEEELLDILVQPLGEILDLNSRYSGVWPEDMARAADWTPTPSEPHDPLPATTSLSVRADHPAKDTKNNAVAKTLKKVSSPQVARDLLFSLLAPSTPLIGHGLENDLNAVRVVHPTLIDTVLLYPHKAGLPYRNGLKMLMEVHLNKKIQVETGPKPSGHDSAEDARAAGELVRLKIVDKWKDMQRAGWRLLHGEIWPPGKPEEAHGKFTEAFIETQEA